MASRRAASTSRSASRRVARAASAAASASRSSARRASVAAFSSSTFAVAAASSPCSASSSRVSSRSCWAASSAISASRSATRVESSATGTSSSASASRACRRRARRSARSADSAPVVRTRSRRCATPSAADRAAQTRRASSSRRSVRFGQRLLGGLALAGDALERALRAVPRGAGDVGLALGVLQRRVPGAHGVARELPASLVDLALQALVQLRGLGLALERAQPRARLALDVQRAVEVRLRALQLELGAAAALAVLAEAGGLLDEQPAVARAGGDDRLDAALGHDGVHLLAQAGVAEDLQHVDEAAARAVEPVLAVARAVEPPEDGDLADREVDRAVRVVEDELDLGRRARLHAATAAEDDVLHRLPAHRERRLLAHRPEHRVGDVGLARAVGADDDRHPGPELHARAVRERLEALHGDRPQVHQLAASATGRSSSAARAASCSAAFFERPRPRPTSSSATRATTSKIRSCGGPISSATS